MFDFEFETKETVSHDIQKFVNSIKNNSLDTGIEQLTKKSFQPSSFILQNLTSKFTKKIKKIKFNKLNNIKKGCNIKINSVRMIDEINKIEYTPNILNESQKNILHILENYFKEKPIWLFKTLLEKLIKEKINIISEYNIKV